VPVILFLDHGQIISAVKREKMNANVSSQEVAITIVGGDTIDAAKEKLKLRVKMRVKMAKEYR
jgi:hypothetical protein